VASLVASLSLSGASALAQSAPNSNSAAIAEALFQEGRRLMESKEYKEACSKFAESQTLDPSGGTLLNLAVCREKAGDLATAWALFHEAQVVASRERRRRRVALAQERIEALSPRLPKLTLNTKAEAEPGEFSLELDGATLSKAVLGTSFPVDPGSHTLQVSAEGHETWSHTFAIEEAQLQSVEIPSLVVIPSPPAKPEPIVSSGVDGIEGHKLPSEGNGRRNWGLGFMGVGTIGLVSGAVFALKSRRADEDSRAFCVDSVCQPEGVRLNEEAKSSALLADVQFAAGLAFVGIGGYLLLTESGSSKRSNKTAAVPSRPRFLGATVQPMSSGAGLSAWGRW
jgi:hypothetical protein